MQRSLRALGFALTTTVITSCTTPDGAPSIEPAAPNAPIVAQQALAAFARVERVELASDGVPYYVRGDLGRLATRIQDVAAAPAALAAALPNIAATFGVASVDLVARNIEHDQLGMTHVRFDQHKHGLRVIGGELVVHLTADGMVRSINGTARDDQTLSANPTTTAVAAAEIARQETADSQGAQVDAGTPELTYVITNADGTMHLAWEVEVTGRDVLLIDKVYVDAHAGRVVDRRPEVYTARNRTVWDGHDGTIPIFDQTQVGSETSPPTGDDIALAAFDNTGATYDCYKELYNRDSYNNAGGTLRSLVHAFFPTPSGGKSGLNAAWLAEFGDPLQGRMVYGDGGKSGSIEMAPLARSFDVTAHEITHGVTATTAKLVYMNESGALNEGMSDIMAAGCEAWKDKAISVDTWLVGEDIFTPAKDGDALRYMANPTLDKDMYPPELGGSTDYYPERYMGKEDSGGVHLNSGIANLAFNLLTVGGKHPRNKTTFMVPAIGIEKAGKIFEEALTKGHFTSNTNFAQARTATEEVANTLYPGGAKTAVGMAWAAVGVGTPPMADTVPPTVNIISPADNATVTAGFSVEVSATDDQGVISVDLSIDGAKLATSTTAPYTFVTPATLGPGSHTIQATAHDAFNEASASITVKISGGACTTDDQCGAGESCEGGVCKPDNSNTGDDPAGCGCASGTDANGAVGSLVLLLGTMLVLRRPRRRH